MAPYVKKGNEEHISFEKVPSAKEHVHIPSDRHSSDEHLKSCMSSADSSNHGVTV